MARKLKVLVVDDEKVVREGCRRVLSGKDYEVLTAENGYSALEQLSEDTVDLILLDLKMPGMSGEEVLETVHTNYPEIPVIIITGHGTVDTAVECMKKGAYDFITKPFQIDQFLITIQRASEKRKLELQAKQFEEENRRNLYDLKLEKSRLKTIINCMANGVLVTNRNLEIVLHNPALMQMMEIKGDLDSPVPVDKFVEDRDFIESLREILHSRLSTPQTVSREISRGPKVIRAISAPALGPDNEVVGTVTVLEDITAFKQLDQMKSDFLNMVAHELRSPLVSIRQQNTVLLEGLAGPIGEKQHEFLGKGVKKIDSLLELINDLLNIAKIEAGKAIQHQVSIDIGEVIKETLSFLEPVAKEKGIVLTYEEGELRPILADSKRMEEVFTNLITNAINYSPDGGRVVISAKALGEYVEIKVSDTGIGIAAEELPKIFDKFYRVKDPKTRQVMGTGLGLSIVKGILDAHRGTIEVESELGKGTTFKILLPIFEQ
ncbi:MAG: response regulator [Deltaproteobacteria bacterium]|nr:response regulator [Deltaproteobacteria bacterium]MBW2082967.1 response regulator [Deltaproteobacteria bacterium]